MEECSVITRDSDRAVLGFKGFGRTEGGEGGKNFQETLVV